MTAGSFSDTPFPLTVVDPRLPGMLGCTEPPEHMTGVVAEAARARRLGLSVPAACNLALALYWRCPHRLIAYPEITLMRPADDETLLHVALALWPTWSTAQRECMTAAVRTERQDLPKLANDALAVALPAVRLHWGVATYFGYVLKAFLQAAAEHPGRHSASDNVVHVLDDYRAARARRSSSPSE